MKKLFAAALFFFVGTLAAAQTSTVSLTATDSDGQAWINGSYQITFVPPSGYTGSAYSFNGSPWTPPAPVIGSLNGAGGVSTNLPRNDYILPANSGWAFKICPLASAPCSTTTVVINQASQDLSSSLVLAAPRFAASQYLLGSYGYNDGEVLPTVPPIGNSYWNVLTPGPRYWNGSAWVLSSAGTGNLTGTLTPGTYPIATGANTVGNGTLNSTNTWIDTSGNVNLGGALPIGQSSSDNTAVGADSLSANTSWKGSSAFGYGALKNSTQAFNDAFGYETMYFTTDGNGANAAFGGGSLYAQTTGTSNSALGNSTLHNLVTGSYNVGIGSQAGNNTPSGSNTTGSFGTFIGYETEALADGDTNETVIGNDAVGNGSNTVTIGNSATTDDYFIGTLHANAVELTGASSGSYVKADGSGYGTPSGTGTTTNALTAAASGGASPGSTFNGSAAVTFDYHSVGADVYGAAATAQSNAETFATNSGSSNTINATQLKGVPFCAGFTPTTGENLQYTTASSPNPCYTAASGSGSGTVSGQAAGVIPLGTSATVIGAQSHMDDGVTTAGTITSTEPVAAPSMIAGTPTTAAKAFIPSGAHGFAGDETSTQSVPAASVDGCQYDSVTHTMLCSQNNSAPINPVPVNTVEASGSPATLLATTGFFWNNTASAYAFDLPVPVPGLQMCFGQYQARTSAISLIPPSGTTIYFKGVAGTSGSATGLVSGGAAGDFICLVATSTTTYQAIGGGYGTWTNN